MPVKSLYILFFLAIGLYPPLYGQATNTIWYFGHNAGLDFSTNPPKAISGQLNSNEGCAVICDNAGKLLFYSNGANVWDASHQLMPGGTNMAGGFSSTQAALIVPLPGSCTKYYLFYMEDHNEDGDFYYSIIDMSLRNGLGDIQAGNKDVFITKNVGEKAIAIPHKNGVDCWIITHRFGSNQFLAYLLTIDGLSVAPVISGIGSHYSNAAVIGPVKASHDGKKIVSSASFHNICDMFDFDKATGVLSNFVNLIPTLGSPKNVYGIEFSPDNNLLYLTSFWTTSYLYQLRLSDMSIYTLQNIPGNYIFGALQLGPNDKIYLARENQNFLGVIQSPNEHGNACNYEASGQLLAPGTTAGLGLPNVTPPDLIKDPPPIFSIGADTTLCKGDTIILSTGISGSLSIDFIWEDSSIDSIKTITEEGYYWVTASNACGAFSDTIHIQLLSPPHIMFHDTMLCEGQPLLLDATQENASYLWTDQSTGPTLTVDQNGTYAATVTNECGSSSSMIEVIFTSLPEVSLMDTLLCAGEEISLDVSIEEATYSWSDSSTSPFFYIDQAGFYVVTVTNACGSTIDTMEVTMPSSPLIQLYDTTICEGEIIVMDVTSEGSMYNWSDGSSESILIINGPGVYAVTVTNECGMDSASSHVVEMNCTFKLYMPNVFSPNQDGINDFLGPAVSGTIVEYKLMIFDRWGNQIFQSNQYQDSWDGRFKNQPSPPGVYAYTLYALFSNGLEKKLKGDITLLR